MTGRMTNHPGSRSHPTHALTAVAAELRTVGKEQAEIAEALVVQFAGPALARGMDPSVLVRLQDFDRLSQEIEELARVIERLAAGESATAAVRVRLGNLMSRLNARLDRNNDPGLPPAPGEHHAVKTPLGQA